MDTAREDFCRFSHFHTWYKHMTLKGDYFTIALRKGQQQRYFTPVDDSVCYHWHIERLKNDDEVVVLNAKYKIRLNYFLMHTWKTYGDSKDFDNIYVRRGGHVFRRDFEQLNALIATSYPHLSKLGSSESLSTLMKEEFSRMYAEFTAAASQYLEDNPDVAAEAAAVAEEKKEKQKEKEEVGK